MTKSETPTEHSVPRWINRIGEFVEEYGARGSFLPAIFAAILLSFPVRDYSEWDDRTGYGKVLIVLQIPLYIASIILGGLLALFVLCQCSITYSVRKLPEMQPAIYKDGVQND